MPIPCLLRSFLPSAPARHAQAAAQPPVQHHGHALHLQAPAAVSTRDKIATLSDTSEAGGSSPLNLDPCAAAMVLRTQQHAETRRQLQCLRSARQTHCDARDSGNRAIARAGAQPTAALRGERNAHRIAKSRCDAQIRGLDRDFLQSGRDPASASAGHGAGVAP